MLIPIQIICRFSHLTPGNVPFLQYTSRLPQPSQLGDIPPLSTYALMRYYTDEKCGQIDGQTQITAIPHGPDVRGAKAVYMPDLACYPQLRDAPSGTVVTYWLIKFSSHKNSVNYCE